MRNKKYTQEELINATKQSTNLSEVLKSLKLSGGGSYKQIKNEILKLNIDTSHFISNQSHKGVLLKNNFHEILKENSTYSRSSVKKDFYNMVY